MDKKYIKLSILKYRNIYIIDNRDSWISCEPQYDINNDLVLTIDFGLKKLLEQQGGHVYYLDHLIDKSYIEEQNYKMHFFLNNWFKNDKGEDLFSFEGIKTGNAFLLDILNEVSNRTHLFVSLLALREVEYEKIIVADFDPVVAEWLKELQFDFLLIETQKNTLKPVYFFPIAKWMQERMENRSLKARFKLFLLRVMDYSLLTLDFFKKDKRPAIFIQSYYPTRSVIGQLKKDQRVRIITASYSGLKGIFHERRILYANKRNNHELVSAAIKRFKTAGKNSWIIDGIDIAAYLYPVIERKVFPKLGLAYSRLMDIKQYFRNRNFRLMIPITDYWMENRLLMNYCQKEGIPVFMIINGLLTVNFVMDGKDADYVNSYGESIKYDYFKGRDNVVCLGDPRMDQYYHKEIKPINRKVPTIVIGAAGYSILDLNSYVAYEFDFLYDVLYALNELTKNGYEHKIIIKVRGNGYHQQYDQFVKEYFPGSDIEILWDIPFADLIVKADYYISFYSQTIFEASCLGIPALYYKNDTQISNRPFDGNSELVTAYNIDDLKEKIILFYNDDPCYQDFLAKEVMAKHIGPLDGENTRRNVDYIYSLLK